MAARRRQGKASNPKIPRPKKIHVTKYFFVLMKWVALPAQKYVLLMKGIAKYPPLLVLGLLLMAACVKDDNGSDQGPEPPTRQEIEQRIVAKWKVSGIPQIQTVEFADDGTYAITGSLAGLADFNALARASEHGGIRKLQEAPGGSHSEGPEYHIGTYAIGTDGRIVLDDLITIAISKITETAFEFEIKLPGMTTPLKGKGEIELPVTDSERTDWLTKKWIYNNSDESWQGATIQFTKYGTMLLSRIETSESQATNPGGGTGGTEVTKERVNYLGEWSWTGQSEVAINVTIPDEETGRRYTERWGIQQLFETGLTLEVRFGGEYTFYLRFEAAR